MNYSYTEATVAADQVQLYKLVARQVAAQMELTASFLPKPVAGVNGNGMHTNMSLSRKGKNLFYAKSGDDGLSKEGWTYLQRILSNANDICLVLNSSVNSYRRLDPHFEAPNQIKASAIDRGSMVRIPLGNERSARVEVRSIAPDANPYLAIYALLRTGVEGPLAEEDNDKRPRTRFLPGQHLRRDPAVQVVEVRRRADGRGGARQVRRAQADVGRALPEGARSPGQAQRDPVPPRGDEPIPLVAVLSRPGREDRPRD